MMINWLTISLRDFAGLISEELRKRGIDTVLVGGACVTIYSHNRYQSYDLDYVTYEDMRKVKKALKELGFVEKQRFFRYENCPWFVEFVSPPVAIGNEAIQNFSKVKTTFGTIKMLRPIDSIKDRLMSFYHWNDQEGLEQAVNVSFEQNIGLKSLKKWSEDQGHQNKFQIFEKLLKKRKTEINEAVHIVPYNPRWPLFFLEEKELLFRFLENRFIDIEHIGSTSIPGLTAKPIVDIMIGVDIYPPVNELITMLCSQGYLYYGEAGVPERIYLIKRGVIDFNLTVVVFNGDHWKTNLKFRDYLIQHPEVCREYEETKRSALESGAKHLLSYSNFKRSFLQRVTADALVMAHSIGKCNE